MSDSEEKPRRRSRKREEEDDSPEVPAEDWTEEPQESVEESPPPKSRIKLKPSPIQPIKKEEAAEPPKPVRKRASKPKESPPPEPIVEAPPPRRALRDRVPLLATKPRLEVKAGKAAKQEKQARAAQPLTCWQVVVGLLPVWALLLMILILAPTLPFEAVGAAVNWGLRQLPKRPTQSASEPVYIVEDSGAVAPMTELPPPNWPLEISGLFMPSVQHWSDDIARWSVTYRIKPNMIATIMQIESCGDPTASSPLGATGLFQVMPLHFEAGEDSHDPDTNAKRGLLYLGQMLAAANGDPGRTFAAYNGGPSMLYTSPGDWPTETSDYYIWASGIYEDAEFGLDESPTLDAWLDAGGESLCAQAAAVLGLR